MKLIRVLVFKVRVFILNPLYIPHPCSSVPSLQSYCPLHTRDLAMHCPLEHVACVILQAVGGRGVETWTEEENKGDLIIMSAS